MEIMFNQQQPRRFKLKTHLSDSKDAESSEQLKSKWEEMRGNTKRRGSVLTSFPVLIVFLVSVFILIYILNGYIK